MVENENINRNHISELIPVKGDKEVKAISIDDIRSEEVTEIIGKMPHWIIRRGITILGLLCIVILTGAYFFKYPDIIPAKVTITSGSPPVKLVARNSLPIQRIFVKNDEHVSSGQALCVFYNAARYEDVMQIVSLAKTLDTTIDIKAAITNISVPVKLQLGELQSNYIELYQTLQSLKFFLQHNAYDATIGTLSNQIHYSTQLQTQQHNMQQLQQEQLKMQQRQFAADSSLLNSKVISRVEYEESKRKMLDQQMNSGNNKTVAIQNKLQESEYRKSIAIASLQKTNDLNDLLQKVKDAVKRFQGQYAQWEQNYILKSPIDGKVSFFNVWKENQFVTAGEGIMVIVPPVQGIVVRGMASMERYGKVQAGQKVLLKLQAYPYQEYGMLEATLTKHALVAMDSNFSLEMMLKQGLVTNVGKRIPMSPVLVADGEIVTDDKSVLARLFEKVIGNVK